MEQQGEWRRGLCGGVCGADSCGMCLGAWCCSCFVYGKADQRLSNFPNGDDPSLCSGGCWLMCAAACCHLHWLVATMKRNEERNKFGIKGNGCVDCLASYFCFPCTIAQMDSEVKERAALARQGGGMSQAYSQPQGGMMYQPPSQQAYVRPQHM